MGKNRKSKRQLIRDEKRAKKREREVATEDDRMVKRQRCDEEEAEAVDSIPVEEVTETGRPRSGSGPEREFFGMLADQEQEYFRRADELLELNNFPSIEERNIFLQNVYKEVEGKELKLSSSQSCSRLMERLILLSSSRQKKHLFEAFAGHFITLVTHRFASHCCEQLFLQSAPLVTKELGLLEPEMDTDGEGKLQVSMEDLFLLTLDELEEYICYLLSDRYGSHALRTLLVILSGRPLDQVSTGSLLQSKKKEKITVEDAAASDALTPKIRAVPSSFPMAIKKIITDATANMDITALRVLATHPTGNPTLQLLLDLDISMIPKAKTKGLEAEKRTSMLLDKLIPGAPSSFSDPSSPASEFVTIMLYDILGSRLLETLVQHCPGKIFKGLQLHIFGPRISGFLRNETACYPAIRVLDRLSKDDLGLAVLNCLPEMPAYVKKGRFNVIRTLFERCHIRQATDEIYSLLKALTSACGGDWKHIVPALCCLDEAGEAIESARFKKDMKKKAALLSHGSQVVKTLLGIPGQPAKAIQVSIMSLNPKKLIKIATSSAASSQILIQALSTISHGPFHKVLVASLLPYTMELVNSQQGHNILNAVIAAPSQGNGITVPFHLKENIMSILADHEGHLRESWLGRSVWRSWKGDMWGYRRHDWVRWAKEADSENARVSKMPKPRHKFNT